MAARSQAGHRVCAELRGQGGDRDGGSSDTEGPVSRGGRHFCVCGTLRPALASLPRPVGAAGRGPRPRLHQACGSAPPGPRSSPGLKLSAAGVLCGPQRERTRLKRTGDSAPGLPGPCTRARTYEAVSRTGPGDPGTHGIVVPLITDSVTSVSGATTAAPREGSRLPRPLLQTPCLAESKLEQIFVKYKYLVERNIYLKST